MGCPLCEILGDVEDLQEDIEMLWVSIHDTVDGPKLRNLYKTLGCSKYEATGVLTLLWLWGLSNAERSGKIPYADRDDLADVISRNIVGSKLSPETIVDAMIQTRWLDEKEDGIYLHDWNEWQSPFYAYKDRNARSAEAMRAKRAAEADGQGKAVQKRKATDYTDDFERIWKKYPRNADKGMGYAKYNARLAEGHTVEELERAVEGYATECKREHTEERFIKHMSTFFSEKLPFMEYLDKQEKTESYEDFDPFA